MKVRVTCFWEEDTLFLHTIRKYAFDKEQWKDLTFVTDDTYDRLVILTRPHHTMQDYDPGKAITLLTEPPESPHVVPHPTSAVQPVYLPLPFWAQSSLKQRIRKTALLSSVTSDLCSMEGHQRRLELIYELDKVVESGFDLWGKRYQPHFFDIISAYRGDIKDKYAALWKYRYHLACENSFLDNYFTEKIADPVIAECLCFYDGCTNVERFIDDRAFIRINVKEPQAAIETIVQSIEDNEWRKRIRYIRQQKQRLLHELNPLNIIWLCLHEKEVLKACML